MEHIQGMISNNLKMLRQRHKLSLDDVANMSGVSKSLIRQIEKEESNPTITTLWKIANGLKIPFSSLIQYDMPDTEIVRKNNIAPLKDAHNLYRLYPSFSYEDHKPFEMYMVELDPGALMESGPHRAGTVECITVVSGNLTMKIENHRYTLQRGDSIKFSADRVHSYMNEDDEEIQLSMTIYYPS